MRTSRALSLLAAIGMLLSYALLAPEASAQGVSTLAIDFSVKDPSDFRPVRLEVVRTDQYNHHVVHAAEVDEPGILDLSVPPGRYVLHVQDKETGIIQRLPAEGFGYGVPGLRSTHVRTAGALNFIVQFETSMADLHAQMEGAGDRIAEWKSLPDEVLVKFGAGTPISIIY